MFGSIDAVLGSREQCSTSAESKATEGNLPSGPGIFPPRAYVRRVLFANAPQLLPARAGTNRNAKLLLEDNGLEFEQSGGEGGIRTPGTGFSPYNGLANRRLQPLGHLSVEVTGGTFNSLPLALQFCCRPWTAP